MTQTERKTLIIRFITEEKTIKIPLKLTIRVKEQLTQLAIKKSGLGAVTLYYAAFRSEDKSDRTRGEDSQTEEHSETHKKRKKKEKKRPLSGRIFIKLSSI